MRALLGKRIVLVTGKGGVGRSTLAAALALSAARAGRRVLLTEIGEPTGDFSPLARMFGLEHLPSTPETIAPGIKGSLLWAREGQTLFLSSVLPSAFPVRTVMGSKSLGAFLEAAPSFHEMGVYYHLLELLRERDRGRVAYDFMVLDMPATGHTMALTSLPDILLRLVPTGAMADALREGQSYLHDPAQTSALVVTLPETLPVTECLELIEGLRRTKVPVGAVALNRFPADPFSPEEHAALAPLMQRGGAFGVQSYQRLLGSRRARTRLKESLGEVPLLVLPQLSTRPGALPQELSTWTDRGGMP